MHQMFPAFHLPEHVDGCGALCSTGLRGLHLPLLGHRRERGHSVGQGGDRPREGGIAQVPRALTRFPPMPQGKEAEKKAQVPGDLFRVRSRTAARTGAEGPEMRQRDHAAHGERGPPQRPARPLVLAADAIRPLGMASIVLPSAAEGSCPVELGNPPIFALTLMRHKGCTVLRIRFQLHQCGALKSLG